MADAAAVQRFLIEVVETAEAGGFVMWPLIGAAAVLWYALGYRAVVLRGGLVRAAHRRAEVVAVRGHVQLRPRLDEAFDDLVADTGRMRSLVQAIVMVAPLTGLLGTVAGMMETFDGLGDMALFSRSGGVAGGISQALLTTQMGLFVAIPGLVAGRLLDRRARRLVEALEQVKNEWCGRVLS